MAVSAPGKVLLAGGYLVLDRAYTGLVFGLDARIHVHLRSLRAPTSVGDQKNARDDDPKAEGEGEEFVVRSPQFVGAEWRYRWDGGRLRASSNTSASRNPFVETALAYALTYVSTVTSSKLKPCSITILADDDYYSSTGSSFTASPWDARQREFRSFKVELSKAHKTGLGSSAALVTAFTAGVMTHYLEPHLFSATSAAGQAKLHNLAQTAHCAAQGKIGSGFDVAAAVYGSCLYRRFSSSVLSDLGDISSGDFARRLRALVDGSDPTRCFDAEIHSRAVAVPKGMRLVMCDVDCGSETVGMAKQVLAWRAEKSEEADALWRQLQEANETLAKTLARLDEIQREAPEEYQADLETITNGVDKYLPKRDKLWRSQYCELLHSIATIRASIRAMSAQSGVPIEPAEQTELLDACTALRGVLGGVVPGAGGYDAVALLIIDEPDVLERLSRLLDTWTAGEDGDATGESTTIGKVRPLGVREEKGGVRVEDEGRYAAWLS
ncbi:MAG: phosphomevalonate kinase [Thelocarpon impressellum]|nr:MAG: phosphomevalonate kinase [Thelocarpon impressellum]